MSDNNSAYLGCTHGLGPQFVSLSFEEAGKASTEAVSSLICPPGALTLFAAGWLLVWCQVRCREMWSSFIYCWFRNVLLHGLGQVRFQYS